MKRQVGDLMIDEHGMARRGLLVRHLVMPGLLDETEAILRFIATEVGRGTYVNLMAQYYPAGRTSEFPEIDRHLYRSEFERALHLADQLGAELRHETAPCEDGTVILLATDGFSALVDLYRAMDATALMEAALSSGLEPLVRLAREIETERDPDGRLYPRFKLSDDTTAILLRA